MDIEFLERERARLEQIALDLQAENSKLARDNDRLKADLAERGKVNARLNRDLQRALRVAGREDSVVGGTA